MPRKPETMGQGIIELRDNWLRRRTAIPPSIIVIPSPVTITIEPDDAPPRYAREIDDQGRVVFLDLNP